MRKCKLLIQISFWDSDSKDKIWRFRLLNKMLGHSSAITVILHHPNDALVSTLDDSMAQFLQMDGKEKEKRIALSQSALDIAEAIDCALKFHQEDLVVALNAPVDKNHGGLKLLKILSRKEGIAEDTRSGEGQFSMVIVTKDRIKKESNRFRAEGAILKNLYSRSPFPSRYAFAFQQYSMTQFLQMDSNEKEKRIALSQSALRV